MLAALTATAVVVFTFPFSGTPDWGSMTAPAQWNRTYSQYKQEEFVPIPKYDLAKLTIPTNDLLKDREANNDILTAKLFYSTRYCGVYDLDKGEHTGTHCAIDMKEPLGTPVLAAADGRVSLVRDSKIYGHHVVIEHADGHRTVYAHLGKFFVLPYYEVKAGDVIGEVGMTGNTSSPHLHFEVWKGDKQVNPMELFPDLVPRSQR